MTKHSNDYREKQNKYLLATYGISLNEKLERLKRNSNRCEICDSRVDPNDSKSESPPAKGGKRVRSKSRTSVVDHCHKTGKVRGILCIQCNAAIGLFRDRPEVAFAAAEYLQHHQLPQLRNDFQQLGLPGFGWRGMHNESLKDRWPTVEDFKPYDQIIPRAL